MKRRKKVTAPDLRLNLLLIIGLFVSILIALYLVLYPKKVLIQKAITNTTPVLTREGQVFKLDGVEISPFGLRAVNAIESDTITQIFLDNLDNMKSYGIQSLSISFQGGRFYTGNPGTVNAFTPAGDLKPEYIKRMSLILNKLAQKNMVGVVTYYYQGHDQEFIDESAVINAAKNATEFLKPWRNIWLYTINEFWVTAYDHDILSTPNGQQIIYDTIKEIDPERIVVVSDTLNDGFLVETGRMAENGNVVVEYKRLDEYSQPGVFTKEERQITPYHAEVTANNKSYWFYHAAWHQSVQKDASGNYIFPRFDPGGSGTDTSPGTMFIWKELQRLSKSIRNPIYRIPPASPSPTPATNRSRRFF